MGIEFVLAGIVALQVANLVIAMGCLLRRHRPAVAIPAPPDAAPAIPAPVAVPKMSSGNSAIECATCHRAVARFTLTDAGAVCANCKPLE